MIGSLAASTLMSLTKEYLGEESRMLQQKLDYLYTNAVNKINQEYIKIVDIILQEYHRLGSITKMAFDFESNAVYRFQSSKLLALEYMEEKYILKDLKEVDSYFLD